MAHNDKLPYVDTKQVYKAEQEENKSLQQQLTDANKEIEELTLQLAWLERAYE